MADFASGTWNMVESKQFDDYMKALGVGYVMRKMGNLAKPTQHISVDGNNWNIKTVTAFKSSDFTYVVGANCDETTIDGRNVQTMSSVDGNKLVLEQNGEPKSVITREFNGDDMTMTLECNGVVCTRHYKRADT